ncbi:AVAST type 4 anti-phage nuclease Avs4 [Flavobacterium fluviatile]|uniref:AVAST type 4 anti-phage nuclease Avs4 n=1 Tax=Flavobacterium fluviatile TaxID=1862387 RepID=UPI0013D0E569|nr:AVAST type 4 anti-phage nuclease Avs4 [Flavobacterium fluviatile]
MNWKIFDLKYNNREQWAFEQLSYLLFCSVFGNKIGLFRYKNQTGIETEPFEKEGKYYGFQAKYYTSSISQKDIIESITKAKSKNPHLNTVYLYTNIELSESSKTDKKKPKYQIEIEKAAQKIDIEILWQVPSHFELQLSLPENKYIQDLFFKLEPDGAALIDEIVKHNENILQAIQTEINFNGSQIKIDRSGIIEQLNHSLGRNENIIISGEGGCGKTAVFKEFYNTFSTSFPICIFKATELNVSNINELLRFNNNFTFDLFFEAYEKEPKKVFVIDSAEKLAELANNDILNKLIKLLISNGWNIVFTTRYSYLNDLSFHITENYQLSCEVINIPLITPDELTQLSEKNNFILPANENFSQRLSNLFYLNEYIKYYPKIDKEGNFRNFIDLIWKKKIQNSNIQRDNLHLERDRSLIYIAKKRCELGLFYISPDTLPQSALFHLKQDEILGYDQTHNGYFITHDIYEEWALDKIISRTYANHVNVSLFFEELGNSLPIRRAFRLWMSEQLSKNSSEVETFVQNIFVAADISQFWKDELLISILLSDYSEYFFNFFENNIISEEFKTLKRILFLLRIACTEIAATKDFYSTAPKGKGWEVVIAFIDKYKSSFFENNLPIILPILADWTKYKKDGETTRISGLLALSIIEKTETIEKFYIDDKAQQKILNVVFNSSNEISSELKNIFDKVIANQWRSHNSPYEGLCSTILSKPYLALNLIKKLPLSVIELCGLFWRKSKKKKHPFESDSFHVETKYGIADEFRFNYSPASAYQTPIYWLLQNSFYQTLDFIIEFTNDAVESYRKSDYGKDDVTEITLYIENEQVKQYLCWAFWGAYRGFSSPVVPYLLQSVHMALEKMLLELAELPQTEILEKVLLKLLKSKSASITAVVCSVILAYPDKFYNVALVLFKTLDFFHMDSSRSLNEHQAKSLYSIGFGLDHDTFYNDERIKTCEDSHRNLNLERIFLNYQFCGVTNFTEDQNTDFINSLYKILDIHKENLSQKSQHENHTLHILLARMDRRNLSVKILSKEDNKFVVEFTPNNLSEEQKQQSEQAVKDVDDTFKYSFLRTWGDFISGREQTASAKLLEYDSNPLTALLETKQLVQELKEGRQAMGIFDYSIPGHVCSKLMIQYKDILSPEDKDFCNEIILTSISELFSDDYDYQISDGVEASINAVPALMQIYPQNNESCVSILVLSLFDRTPIGYYKRICDYAIEAIHKSNLWQTDPVSSQKILLGFCILKPIYDSIYKKKKKESGHWQRISKETIFVELENQLPDFSFDNLSFEQIDIAAFSIQDLEIIYQLIPSNTKDRDHLTFYQKSLPKLAAILLQDRRTYREENENIDIYKERVNIFKRYAYFILEREKSEMDIYLNPFKDSFQVSEETVSFLDQIIFAQDRMNHYEQFWQVWDSLYPAFISVCKNSRSYSINDLIWTYLLAWNNWRENTEQWHSLKKENLALYRNVAAELVDQPAVLYSVAKVVNSIGSKFTQEGIDLIYPIIFKNRFLNLGKLQSNTEYYLEIFMRKFIFINKKQIKQDIRLKNKVIPILDFMIERGSIHGYLMRESIL